MRTLEKASPIFGYTKLDDTTFNFTLEAEGRHMSFNFTLGEEKEVERRDGEKVKVVFTKPSDNVLNQKITMPDGKLVYFSREFYGNEAKMIVRMDDTDVQATIYYEAVE
ncbi:fatty acid-binding protein-like isoform X2 [Epargyreus clarus]